MNCLKLQEEKGGLMEELHRLSSENEKLTQKLRHMFEKYNVMENQLKQLIIINNNNNKNPEKEKDFSSSSASQISIRKRKNIHNNDQMIASTSGDHIHEDQYCCSSKRPRNNTNNCKVSKVLVRIHPSDTALVCSIISLSFLSLSLLRSYIIRVNI